MASRCRATASRSPAPRVRSTDCEELAIVGAMLLRPARAANYERRFGAKLRQIAADRAPLPKQSAFFYRAAL